MVSAKTKAYAFVLAGATLLATLGVWGRLIYPYEPDPLTVVTWRALFASAILAAILAVARPAFLKVRGRDFPFFCVYGFLAVTLNFVAYFSAIKYVAIGVAAVLLYTYPAFVTFLSLIFLGERLTPSKAAALLLTLVGCVLVIGVGREAARGISLIGALYGLAAGFTAALYSIFGKRALARYPPWTVVFYAFLVGSIFLALWRGPATLLRSRYPIQAWIWILSLTLIPTLGGYTLYTRGLQGLEASRASIAATWEVAIAALLGLVLFGERLDLLQLGGGAFILAGIALVRMA